MELVVVVVVVVVMGGDGEIRCSAGSGCKGETREVVECQGARCRARSRPLLKR